MFDNFPYTDMHQLNLDWIIKIAKDFLDQYTHIQELISDGEQSLNDSTSEGIAQLTEKAEALETALQNVYNGYSSDLSGEYTSYHDQLAAQLTQAVADMNTALMNAQTTFNTAANAKQEQVLDSIPDDYSALSTAITEINDNIESDALTFDQYTTDLRTNEGHFIDENGGLVSYSGWAYSPFMPIEKGDTIAYAWGSPDTPGNAPALVLYDENMNFFKCIRNQTNTTYGEDSYTIADEQVRYFIYNITNVTYCSDANQYLRITTNVLHFNKPIYNRYNYFNQNVNTPGLIDENGVRDTSFSTWNTTPFIPVNTGDIVSYRYGSPDQTGQAPALLLYDKNKAFIRPIKNRTNPTQYGPDTYIIADPLVRYVIYNICPTNFVTYANQYIYVNKRIPYTNKQYFYVGSTRTGANTFKTIKEVTEYIENNGIMNSTVYLDDETFRIDLELGATFLANYSYSSGNPYSGPRFMNNTHYIGKKNTRIYFWYDGNNTQVNNYISPVNIAGDCILEGIRIDCAAGRYCVHDDIPTSGREGTIYNVQIINCNMRHYGTIAGALNAPICIGGGCNKDTRHIIIGGKYQVDSADTDMSISYHPYNTSVYGNGDSEVIIRDVWTNKKINFADYGNSSMLAFVTGCWCYGIVNNVSGNRLTLYAWNNVTN